MVIYSFAKVNLFLRVLNKRPDNYHNLDTLFERISLCDKITLKPRRDNLIKVRCNNPLVPLDESNLCYRAALALRAGYGIDKGLDIKITKRIPVGSGLGGGSSNAASVLLGLNKLWGLKLSKTKLAKLSAKLGSDVPFFVYDAPFARGLARGEKIRVLTRLNKVRLWHILIVPEIHVSTSKIYKKLDSFSGLTPLHRGYRLGKNSCVTGLTKPAGSVKILTSILVKKNPTFKPGFLFNSLEQVTFKLFPRIRRVKERLIALGLNNALMSGSGSAVFAIIRSKKEALKLAQRLKQERAPWRIFVASTVRGRVKLWR